MTVNCEETKGILEDQRQPPITVSSFPRLFVLTEKRLAETAPFGRPCNFAINVNNKLFCKNFKI